MKMMNIKLPLGIFKMPKNREKKGLWTCRDRISNTHRIPITRNNFVKTEIFSFNLLNFTLFLEKIVIKSMENLIK